MLTPFMQMTETDFRISNSEGVQKCHLNQRRSTGGRYHTQRDAHLLFLGLLLYIYHLRDFSSAYQDNLYLTDISSPQPPITCFIPKKPKTPILSCSSGCHEALTIWMFFMSPILWDSCVYLIKYYFSSVTLSYVKLICRPANETEE